MICRVLDNNISVEKLTDRNVFESMYKKNVSAWDWKARNDEKKEEVFSNFYVFKKWENILWWVSLTLTWDIIFLQCLDVSESWKRYWSSILNYVTSLWFDVVTFTKKWWFFEKFWFEKIEGEVSSTWAEKYEFKAII